MEKTRTSKAVARAIGIGAYALVTVFATMFAIIALCASVSIFTGAGVIGVIGAAAAGWAAWMLWSIRKDALS